MQDTHRLNKLGKVNANSRGFSELSHQRHKLMPERAKSKEESKAKWGRCFSVFRVGHALPCSSTCFCLQSAVRSALNRYQMRAVWGGSTSLEHGLTGRNSCRSRRVACPPSPGAGTVSNALEESSLTLHRLGRDPFSHQVMRLTNTYFPLEVYVQE